MTMMLMQNYRNNICDLNELGVYNVDEDNKTQGYGKYRGKTIVIAMTLMMMQDHRNKFGDKNDLGNFNDDDVNKTQDCSECKGKQKL